jgi:nicotinamidase/pyrazinamidase
MLPERTVSVMRALIVVDVQSDFIPGGSLAVPGGDQVIPIINRLSDRFDLVTATQDWHPSDHGSFAANHPGRKPGDVIVLNGLEQVLWPVHCVQDTPGAQFAPGLDRCRVAEAFHKGTDPGIDSYSTFFDNAHRRSTGLDEYLKSRGVTDVYLAGLATDYCVLYSALDARGLGFDVYLITDACRGINLHPGDVDRAVEQMKRSGVRVISSDDV